MLLILTAPAAVATTRVAQGQQLSAAVARARSRANNPSIEGASTFPGSTPSQLASARKYLYGGLFWGTAAELWTLAILGWLVFSGRAARLRSWCVRRRRGSERAGEEITGGASSVLTVVIYSATLVAFISLAALPFDCYLGFFRERAFGFQHRTLAVWFLDWLKLVLVSVALSVAGLAIGYAVIRRVERRWWIWAWGLAVVFAIFAVAVEPVAIEPLFNKFTPVQNAQLRERILHMAREAGVPVSDVYEVNRSRQSGHTNAYVTGLLGSQRVVIYDTLLRAETPEEIEFVVGHELGHYVLHHIWKGLAFAAVLFGLMFWLLDRWFRSIVRRRGPCVGFTRISDVAGLPLVLLLAGVMLFLASPIENGFSRREEHQADAFGLSICPDPVAAITGFEKDVATDLIDPDPPRWIEWWFFSHPSDRHRIEFAEAYCREHGIAVPRSIEVRD